MTPIQVHELRQMPMPELIARYRHVFGREPRVKHREWLWKRIAWKIQEQATGGLSNVAKQRLEELIAEIHLPIVDDLRTVAGKLRDTPTPRPLSPGTLLTRRWQDREILVEVLAQGFAYQGTVYRSLSAIAKAVTGAHWNGKLFFGLTTRGKA